RDDAIAFISAPSALGLRGRIRGDKNPGGRRDAGATTAEQPPRKDPQMEYSKIVPQSERKN
nr:hypothetical protein [Tanacetum cinerariifolium]